MMLTDQELQSLRNMGNEAERAADEIERLKAHAVVLANTERHAERERCAALCRRVADETRNSDDARAAGRMLANWISTGDPTDPGPNDQVKARP